MPVRPVRALLDLVLPVDCVACGRPGAVLCTGCAPALDRPARPVWPSPVPPGLPAPYAVADYAGVARAALLAYKEHGVIALRAALARALEAGAVAAIRDTPSRPVVVVPAPSSPTARRQRGDDVVARLARLAARRLRGRGVAAVAVPAIRHVRAVADSAGLTAADRAGNLRGAFVATRRLAGSTVVLVDDLITTGATLTEATRALRLVGADVVGCATVAATRRHSGVDQQGLHKSAPADYGAW